MVSIRLPAPVSATAANFAAVALQAGDIDWSLHGSLQQWCVNVGSATLSL